MNLNFKCTVALALSFFLLTISGCVTTHIQSNKSVDYGKKVAKIFVIASHSHESKSFVYRMMESLMQQLNTRGVECAVYMIDELSLNTQNEIETNINKIHPDVVLRILETEKQMSINPSHITFIPTPVLSGLIFDLRMTPVGEDEMIWRGNLEAKGDFNLLSMSKRTAANIVNQLKVDGIIY